MDQWTHIAVSFDSSRDASFYVNGVFIEKVAGNASPRTGSTTGWVIGRCGDDDYFEGYIDDVRIYDYVPTDEQMLVIAGQSASTDPYMSGGSEIRP